jgi:cation transport ATPase
MSSEYRSWKERDADAALTSAKADKTKAEAEQVKQAAVAGAAQTQTALLAEQVKQAKLANQLKAVTESAKDDQAERKARRREQRDENGTTFKTLVNAVMALGLLAALPAQISYFLGLHRKGDTTTDPAWTLAPIPFFLELLAWVGVMGTRWAHRKGLPRWPFWILTATLGSIAGYINLAHGRTEYGPVAGWALAATSVIGPLLAEVRQFLESKAAEDGRDLKQRARDRRAAREQAKAEEKRKAVEKSEDERRRKLFPDVFAEFERVMAAYPTGGISREAAWERAWDTMHALPLAVTAGSMAAREVARTAVETLLADAGRSPESVAVDLFLADTFNSNRGDDGPSGAPAEGRSNGPTGGGSRTRSRKAPEGPEPLGRKGKQPSGRTSAKTPERPLDPAHIEKVRKLAEALGDVDRLSARKVREVIGGGSTEYAVRLRNHVKNTPEVNA